MSEQAIHFTTNEGAILSLSGVLFTLLLERGDFSLVDVERRLAQVKTVLGPTSLGTPEVGTRCDELFDLMKFLHQQMSGAGQPRGGEQRLVALEEAFRSLLAHVARQDATIRFLVQRAADEIAKQPLAVSNIDLTGKGDVTLTLGAHGEILPAGPVSSLSTARN
jgi:hypothetical protein